MEKESSQVIPSAATALDFLNTLGWKISQAQFYRHRAQQKIRAIESGAYTQKDLLKYAKKYLRKKDGSALSAETEQKQNDRLDADTRKAIAHARLAEIKAQALSDRYVLKEDVERGFAARASTFKSDLTNFCYSEASGIIIMVNGDQGRCPDLIEYMLSRVDALLGRYSEPVKFSAEIPFLPGEDGESDEEDEENEAAFADEENHEISPPVY